MISRTKIFTFLLLMISSFFWSANATIAASYDIYVDKSYDGEEEGTSEKPYKTIEKAISESGSKGKKIYVRSGEYKETLTLNKGIEIYGQNKNSAVIKIEGLGTLTLKGDNILENITVSGGYSGVTAEGKVKIKNCVITKATKNGIDLIANSSQAIIEKTELFGNSKGIYAQVGRNVFVTENYIHGNNGEGLDLRQKVRGTISGNDIIGNGEGGIELIIGSSRIKIVNNKIQKNKACGIANQFYSDWDQVGKINITKNTISRNGKYGICCSAPSGGEGRKKGYWNESLDILGNKIDDNKMKAISGPCKIIEAVSEEEEKANEVVESLEAKEENSSESEKETGDKINEGVSLAQENEKNTIETLDKVRNEKDNLFGVMASQKIEIEKENRIKTFFIGPDARKLSLLRDNLEKTRIEMQTIDEVLGRIDSELITADGQKLKEEINSQLNIVSDFINKKENNFSLFGWLVKYFKK